MENDLFSSFETVANQKLDKSFYETMRESRNRPEISDKSDTPLSPPSPTSSETDLPDEGVKIYSHEEVLQASIKYFKGDTLAANVWMNKYALKDSDGRLFELTPDDMHRRLASEIARIEKNYPSPVTEDEIYEVLKDFRYIVPQGSPMAGIGNNYQVSSLSNCFVIGNDGPSDSYGGIMKIDQEQVQLMKRRGGVGHDLSHIRPTGSPVKNSALTSTGVVPFMERYSNSTREVAQDGRRGALMLSISVKHPDAENFIDAKLEQGKVTGANVSVRITDEFMQAVIDNKPFRQQYPVESQDPWMVQEIDARKLWDKIIHNAWASAEPGILFWDTIIRESIPDSYADIGFKTLSTNPCGEIPLCAYDSCRLLAINLYSYVEQPFTAQARFNAELFSKHAHMAQRIMDDIVDLEIEKVDAIIEKVMNDPESMEVKGVELRLWQNIRTKALQGRRTGIGITAEGDMLAALGLRYGSEEAISFSTNVHKLLALEVYRSSVELAEQRGAFEVFDAEKEVNNPFIARIREQVPHVYEKMLRVGRRNIAMLTIAPTGSVSICTQTTSGIEPVFLVSYKRRRKVNPNDKNVSISFEDEVGDSWEEYNVFHPMFETWLTVNGYNVEEVKAYPDEKLDEIITKSPYHKATSNDIDWLSKVKMQGDIQQWVDHSISVTVNIPNDTSQELVSQIYQTAWESGCKGVTIYRDGSRLGVLVSNDKKETTASDTEVFKETTAPPRPRIMESDVVRFQNNYEKWIAVVGKLNGKPYEIFTGKADDFYLPPWVENGWVIREKNKNEKSRYDFQFEDKQGYKITIEGLSRSFNKEFWNYAKLISGILRHGMPLPYVIELVQNLTLDEDNINTWKNGVVRALKRYIPDGTKITDKQCPECGDTTSLFYQDGCLTCQSCGYSKCS
ncbi:MAG: adenosylcobalamin-dependent ribonucleoside-diphosphate reductase [Bacteroidales bacterium]|jgi:ribonucleoside-diphosphate reductase alpha chain|nr:adenosylcobalamin-dependent ribonucleoside-diphosphate reductase [Bacteroidales bacterium]MDD3700872.1 adenosylcobalamin-dependent ribonucleoside-diphosphate reductase [Bacteroidales bacterium]MDY0369831.1 adenosylcobalamin-dependent ribonucleoside-diphosphate reductase [Bacteroidales bacterium]